MQNIGLMDQAYFTPRQEVIDWINNILHVKITKIQQLGTGIIYCQLLDVLFPGKVSLTNLKYLITTMQRLGVKRHIDIQKIAKSKYQDNLQLAQWFKKYVQVNAKNIQDYKASQRRGGIKIDLTQKQPIKYVKNPVEPKPHLNLLKKRDLSGEKQLPLKRLTFQDQQFEEIQRLVLKQKGTSSIIKLQKIKQILFKKNPTFTCNSFKSNDKIKDSAIQLTNSTIRADFSLPQQQKYSITQQIQHSNIQNYLSPNQNIFLSANKQITNLLQSDKKSVNQPQSAKLRVSQNLLDFPVCDITENKQ